MSNIVPFFAVILVLASGFKYNHVSGKPKPFRHDPPKHHEKLWDSAEIKASQVFRIDKCISIYVENKKRYKNIEKMRKGGVPAAIIFTLHGRESTWHWGKHLHEGSRLTGKTRWVPKGRPKHPPANGHTYTFEESAEDALYKLKDLESVDWSKCNTALYNIEKYNGLGYLKYRKHMNSPYMWAGTNKYNSWEVLPNKKKIWHPAGKYVADRKFSYYAVDKQLGTCSLLLRMIDRGFDVGFR